MLINKNTQLGLRINEPAIKLAFCEALKVDYDFHKGLLDKSVETAVERTDEDGKKRTTIKFETDEEGLLLYRLFSQSEVLLRVRKAGAMPDVLNSAGSKYFFICESVYKAAELIKIGDTFTGRILWKIKDGKYTYLMGKHRCARFIREGNRIIGFYYDQAKEIGFEWGAEVDSGEYYFSPKNKEDAIGLMQILSFVELGDIEIVELLGGRNNGKSKKEGKITNENNATVYVIDSRWNTITIRTEGFGVRGHFRLQACGVGMADRKLIWINAFEKHGYVRRPTGEP
jgi:hypothetical protein